MASSVPTLRAAVIGVLQGMFGQPTLVAYGPVGENLPDEIVGLQGIRSHITRPTSAPTRTREETVELDVVFSVWTADATGTDDQRITERAWVMFSTFADYFKTKPNETLGGVCREALVTSYDDGNGVGATSTEDPDAPGRFIVTGRVIEITAVLTAKTRI